MKQMKDGVERSKEQVKKTAEVFTPTELVRKMLDELNIDWSNPPRDRTFLDPTCGNGQFLAELAKRGIPVENIYGVDLMPENIKICRKRIFAVLKTDNSQKNMEIIEHIKNNIRVGNALEYDYSFN